MRSFLYCFTFIALASSALLDASDVWLPDDELVDELPDYLVRAWHFDQETLDVPADVTRIDRAAIERSLAISVPDLLASEANLFFSTVSGNTNVSMRGFGEGSGLRTLILIDGHPLNPADMGRTNWEQIPLDSIESVEVLRGGNNVLYGDKALAGVIKIETRRTGEARLDLEGRIASFGTSQASASGGLGGDVWSVSSGMFREESDGYRDNSTSESRNAYITTGRTFGNGDELDFRLALGETELIYAGGLTYQTYQSDPRASANLGDQGSESRYGTLTGRMEGQRDWGSWEVLSGYDYNDIDWSFGQGSYGNNQQVGYSLKPRARFELDELVMVFGNDVLYDTLDFTQFLDEERKLVPSEAELSERRISPFLLAEYELTDRVSLSAGARYEWVRYEVDSTAYDRNQLRPVLETNRGPRPNPNYQNPADVVREDSFADVIHEEGMATEISLNYRIMDDLSLWLGYDRVYRYPVLDERAAYQGFPLAESVSQNLEAEEGDNYELGLKFLSGSHEFYVTAFLLWMDNEIVFDPTVEGADSLYRGLNINLGSVRRAGGDVAYKYTADQWGCSIRVAYVQTEMRAGEGRGHEVPLVPDIHTVSQVWWEPWESLQLRLVHRYVGERFEGGDLLNTQREIDDYHLFDAQAEFDVSPNCRVFVKVDNIFDRLYAESAFSGSYYPGDGRSISLGVKLNF
jgi:iron complex outermembrane receptor protein